VGFCQLLVGVTRPEQRRLPNPPLRLFFIDLKKRRKKRDIHMVIVFNQLTKYAVDRKIPRVVGTGANSSG
jgi:hypothetical protein